MSKHKSQHYVPRCYLRPFSLSNTGKAINLYNIGTDRLINNAPVRGQCAGDYFYADRSDLALEQALQSIEAAYGMCIRKIQERPDHVDNNDVLLLREFGYLQFLRTDVAISA